MDEFVKSGYNSKSAFFTKLTTVDNKIETNTDWQWYSQKDMRQTKNRRTQ